MRRTRPRVIFECTGPSLTKQSFKQECDVNFVVKNHAQTGMWAHLNPRAPTYGDFTMAVGLEAAMDLVEQAQADFDELPADVRAACKNDPVQLLQKLADPATAKVLVDLGLPLNVPELDLAEQIATGVTAGLANTSGDATPEGEGATGPVTPSN